MEISTLTDPPQLPSFARFTSQRSLAARALETPWLKVEGVSRHVRQQWREDLSTLRDGLFVATYEVRQTTNCAVRLDRFRRPASRAASGVVRATVEENASHTGAQAIGGTQQYLM